MLRRLVPLVAAALFAGFAALQVNDPDPVAWVLVYAVTACISAVAAFRRPSPVMAGVWGVACVFAAIVNLWFWDGASQPMGAASQGLLGEEVVREVGGLLLVALWMAVLAGWGLRARRAASPSARRQA